MDDVLKKLESIDKRISELESDKKDSLKLFGRSYSQAGSSHSDFLIKTKGLVKILWGSKFIDLIKDGKIAVDNEFIFSILDKSEIGVSEGFYVTKDGAVYLKIGDSNITITGDTGTTFVSFMEGLETTSEAKHNALVNIGFIYDSLDKITENSLKNGIVYIESEKKLYTIVDGIISEFAINLANPYPTLIVIDKNDTLVGAIYIRGNGIENSLAFDTFLIYNDSDGAKISFEGALVISFNNTSVTVNANVSTDMIQSIGASSNNGYRLYCENSKSVLEVDKIVERTASNESVQFYPAYWMLNNAVIKSISFNDSDETQTLEENQDPDKVNSFSITFYQDVPYKVNDVLFSYIDESISTETDLVDSSGNKIVIEEKIKRTIDLTITEVNEGSYTVSTELLSKTIIEFLKNKIAYLVKSDNLIPIRLLSNTLDLVLYGNVENNLRIETTKTRIGDFTNLKDGTTSLNGTGIYTDTLLLGGIDETNFPKYTNSLNSKLSSINITNSNKYDCVLVSVGLLRKYLGNDPTSINELKLKIATLEAEIAAIKEQLG